MLLKMIEIELRNLEFEVWTLAQCSRYVWKKRDNAGPYVTFSQADDIRNFALTFYKALWVFRTLELEFTGAAESSR